jgi:uncharacterized Fe-S cluster-containing radical SAM superfamily protein
MHDMLSRTAQKFSDPAFTLKGERRAAVALKALKTLWINTGTLCNIACANCYIESTPKNDRLAYITLDETTVYLDEINRDRLPVGLVGFTGGEPFMNPHFPAILRETLGRGFETLTLTNAMKPMWRRKAQIAAMRAEFGPRMRMRVSLDDWRADIHDAERGAGAFEKTMQGLAWLAEAGVTVEVAGRYLAHDGEAQMRRGYASLFAARGLPIDAEDPQALVLLPEMTSQADPPEITEACWGILGMSPEEVMCANARMVVKRKGADAPSVLACTLIPYDERFELGRTLAEAAVPVPLNHRYCATFCVLGGGVCGAAKG